MTSNSSNHLMNYKDKSRSQISYRMDEELGWSGVNLPTDLTPRGENADDLKQTRRDETQQ